MGWMTSPISQARALPWKLRSLSAVCRLELGASEFWANQRRVAIVMTKNIILQDRVEFEAMDSQLASCGFTQSP